MFACPFVHLFDYSCIATGWLTVSLHYLSDYQRLLLTNNLLGLQHVQDNRFFCDVSGKPAVFIFNLTATTQYISFCTQSNTTMFY